MMSQDGLSMYRATVPVLVRALGNLRTLLEKGAAHAENRKFDPAVLFQYRLYPDMFPLSRQVQIAADNAKGAVARLSGSEIPKFGDDETTFPELIARIEKTLSFVRSIPAEKFEGGENRPIEIKTPRGALNFTGWDYLQSFALPNVYFHITTTYNILRHNGVEIGKVDFLGAV
jgi:hypothetical protein